MPQCDLILSVSGDLCTAQPTYLSMDGVPRGKVCLQGWAHPPAARRHQGLLGLYTTQEWECDAWDLGKAEGFDQDCFNLWKEMESVSCTT